MTGKILLLGSGFALAAALLIGATEAQAKIVQVDCADPKANIQKNIDGVKEPTTIVISGTCIEDVTIEVDDLTLQGDPSVGGTVSGTVTIVGARRVVIDDLTVTGSGEGVVGTEGASFTVQNSDISDNFGAGIGVLAGASAIITGNTIDNNGDDANLNTLVSQVFGDGIDVVGGANAVITDNDITNSLFSGVFVGRNASARFADNTIKNSGLGVAEDCGIAIFRGGAGRMSGGNTITNSGFAAVCVGPGSVFRQGTFTLEGPPFPGETPDTLTQVGGFTVAVDVAQNAFADIRNANITGNIDIRVNSTFVSRNSSITGNISALGNSVVQLRNTVTFIGTLSCNVGSISFGPVACGETCNGAIPGSCVP